MTNKQDKLIPKLRFPEFKNDGEWEIKRLGEVTTRVSQRNYDNQKLPVLTNSATDGVVNQTDYFDREIVSKDNLCHYYVIEQDDFVYNPRISSAAPVGPVSRNRVGEGLISPLYTVFRFTKGDIGFFEQYFQSNYWHKHLRDRANMGARFDRMNISSDDFFNLPIPYPSLEEQKRIAAYLTSLDEFLSKTKVKLERLEAYKKALLQKLFPASGKTVPDLRFVTYNHGADWTKKKLKELIKVNSGRDYKHLHNGSVPVYGTGGFMTSVDEALSMIDAVGIGRKGTIDKPLFLKAPFWTVDTLFYLTSYGEVDIRFFFYLMQLIPWKKYGEQTGVPSLSKNSIEELEVCIPDIREQREIALVCESSDELIKQYEERIEYLSLYKQGLLQSLMC